MRAWRTNTVANGAILRPRRWPTWPRICAILGCWLAVGACSDALLTLVTPPPVLATVPCLDYDGIALVAGDPYVVTPATYAAHLDEVVSRGMTPMTFGAWLAASDGPTPWSALPQRPMLLFSDVTTQTFADHAAPLLAARGLLATIAIESGLLGQPWAMTPSTIRGLEQAGHEIAAHSHSHRDLTTLSAAELDAEIADHRGQLQALGFAVPHYVYPYGAWNTQVVAKVQAAGFVAARATGAADIRGGGYASPDPQRRFAVGCALPLTETSMADLWAYLDNPRVEVEDAFVVTHDVGPHGEPVRADFARDSFGSVPLHDAGDAIRVRLLVRQAGSYRLRARVKVGIANEPAVASDGYRYRLAGRDVAAVREPGIEPDTAHIVWGVHDLGVHRLARGWTEWEVHALRDWAVVVDWLEVTPLAEEAEL